MHLVAEKVERRPKMIHATNHHVIKQNLVLKLVIPTVNMVLSIRNELDHQVIVVSVVSLEHLDLEAGVSQASLQGRVESGLDSNWVRGMREISHNQRTCRILKTIPCQLTMR